MVMKIGLVIEYHDVSIISSFTILFKIEFQFWKLPFQKIIIVWTNCLMFLQNIQLHVQQDLFKPKSFLKQDPIRIFPRWLMKQIANKFWCDN